nr:DUF6121 family protein [Subtercola boreus]
MVFAAVAFVALIVGAFGFITLFTDTEVIQEPDAGTALGPLMVLAATVLLAVLLFASARSRGGIVLRMPVLRSLVIAVSVYLAFVFSGGLLYGLGAGSLISVLIFAAAHAVDPFALALLPITLAVALSYFGVLVARSHN